MVWIIVAPSFLTLLALGVLFPYRVLSDALRLARRDDGSWSRKGLIREMRHLKRFVRRALLIPLVLLGLIQAALLVHYYLLGAGPHLASLFGDYHPDVSLHALDLEAWTAAYQEAAADRSSAFASPFPLLGELLWMNWPLYPIYFVLSLTLLSVHFMTSYAHAERAYVSGVIARKSGYFNRKVSNSIRSFDLYASPSDTRPVRAGNVGPISRRRTRNNRGSTL